MSAKQKYEKIVDFSPAFDKRNIDSSKNYGIGAMQIRFVLKGYEGAVQLLIGTNIYLDKNQTPEIQNLKSEDYKGSGFSAWDLGYHSNKKLHNWHKSSDKYSCPYTRSGKCYYDGSSLQGKRYLKILIEQGSDELWKELKKYYKMIFGNKR